MHKLFKYAEMINLANDMLIESRDMKNRQVNPDLSDRLAMTAHDLYNETRAKMDADAEEQGPAVLDAVRIICDSLRHGNEVLNINDRYFKCTIKELVKVLKEDGVKEFTFSDRGSNTFDACSAFINAGCTLIGMTRVYLSTRDFGAKENDRDMAFEFTIK